MRLHTLSIRYQLVAIILGSTAVALGVGFALVFTYEQRSARSMLVNQSDLFARVAADYNVSALAFRDERAATDSLAKLESVPEIDCATLYDGEGRQVATWERRPGRVAAPSLAPPASRFGESHLFVAQPVDLEGESYGSITLCVSTESFDHRIARYARYLAVVVLLLTGLSALAALKLQDIISGPVLRLADVAQRVSRDGDYSVRAPEPAGDDEIAALFHAWNEMLAQIERRSAEKEAYHRALQRNESRFRSIIESSRNAVYVVYEGRLVYVNPQFVQMFEYSLEEVSAAGFDTRRLVADGLRALPPTAAEVRAGSRSCEIRALTKTGRILDFEVVLSPVDWDGEPAWMGMLHNITERKLAALEREQSLLKVSHEKLSRYAEALESSNQQLEQFAYVASHDLQEPLRTVSSYVQLLARRYSGQLDADADDFIGFAVDGAKRMGALINDLLAYSRINNQQPLVEVDCEQALAQVRSSLQTVIEETGAELEIGPLPTIEADGTQITRLFQNLVNNAIKFRQEGVAPRIRIEARREGEEWRFGVRDNGIGIEPGYLERIFVIFQRLHNREQYPGTGIGLAICKRIVERHQGRIWVESVHGEGSTFWFSLPVSIEDTSLPSIARLRLEKEPA